MSKRRKFPYAERADRFRRAQKALDDASRHPLSEGLETARDVFWAALEDALPDEFEDALMQAKAGDPAGADLLIEFLEADPYFFRSGYLKADAAQYLKRLVLTQAQADRLRAVIANVVASRDGREFRRYCHLARSLDTPAFRERLRQLAATDDRAVRRRAGWVLSALDGAPIRWDRR